MNKHSCRVTPLLTWLMATVQILALLSIATLTIIQPTPQLARAAATNAGLGEWIATAAADAATLAQPLFGAPKLAYADTPIVGTHTIATADVYSCAITSSGGVKCWGFNSSGNLGDGTYTTPTSAPVDVLGVTNTVAISAGSGFACALSSAGAVKCWGSVPYTNVAATVPTLTSGVVALSVGDSFACVIMSSGGAKCWGYNGTGQLGTGAGTSYTPADVVGLTSGVVAISAGTGYSCALTSSGGAKCWGDNGLGQLGDGTLTTRTTPVDVVGLSSGVIAISAGNGQTCAALSSGGAKCWGKNVSYEIGDGTQTNRWTPVSVSGLTEVLTDIVAGVNHSCAYSASGAKCWGIGQFVAGNGSSQTYAKTPVDVATLGSGITAMDASYHTCVMADGAVKCWGGNNYNVLGTFDTYTWSVATDVVGLGSGGGLVLTPLSIYKSLPNPNPPVAGQPVAYTILVTNTSAITMTNVTVTDLPAASLTMTGFTSTPAGSCNTTTRQCTLSSALLPGAVATFDVTFDTSISVGAVISNTASVTADQAMATYPTGPMWVMQSVASGAAATTDLAIVKSAGVAQATSGAAFDYTITVTNNGPSDATNVVATDVLPAGFTFNSATATGGGSCSESAGTVTCTWATLANGASATATINVTP